MRKGRRGRSGSEVPPAPAAGSGAGGSWRGRSVKFLGKNGSQTCSAEGIWKHGKLSLTSSCVGQDCHRSRQNGFQ